MQNENELPRLTQLSKKAGCAAKIGPDQLSEALKTLNLPEDTRRIVGIATGDDAGVFRLTTDRALVQTLDFFTPIVDDPYSFGQIAAANALSDVYAMGGTPLTAMNILCYPIASRDISELAEILRGGAEKVIESGAMLIGGHSIEDDEPKFGLSVTGEVHPERVTTNAGALPGDVIVLTKRLGTGIITTAAKFDECPPDVLEVAIQSMSHLNRGAAAAMISVGIGPEGVHAATDITGFGLLGHLRQMAVASNVLIEIDARALPILPMAEELGIAGNTTRGGIRNQDFVTPLTEFAAALPDSVRNLLVDPQTSGGLAICVRSNRLEDLLIELKRNGTPAHAVIGTVISGGPGLRVMY
ncbi:MAG: selenide, water dikinase SelD [Chthonomonadales bacterium]